MFYASEEMSWVLGLKEFGRQQSSLGEASLYAW